jgi:hypothetical protein
MCDVYRFLFDFKFYLFSYGTIHARDRFSEGLKVCISPSFVIAVNRLFQPVNTGQ